MTLPPLTGLSLFKETFKKGNFKQGQPSQRRLVIGGYVSIDYKTLKLTL